MALLYPRCGRDHARTGPFKAKIRKNPQRGVENDPPIFLAITSSETRVDTRTISRPIDQTEGQCWERATL